MQPYHDRYRWREERQSRSVGFTVTIVLLSAVAVWLAGVTVPGLFGRKVRANEAMAVATLRAIAVAQTKFHQAGALDVDEDRQPEFGTLGELGALQPLRDGGGVKLAERLLSEALASTDADGHVIANGYYFCVYLPDRNGKGVPGTAEGRAQIDPDLAHRYWSCLAWPVERGTTGHRTFFINQAGRIVKTLRPVYSGKGEAPPAGAALVGMQADEIRSGNVADTMRGADGRQWLPVE